jgi:two-component system, NtrC family, response regulator AtoC
VHSEGSKQCIVPAHGKSKLKDCYINANCLSNSPGNARQLEKKSNAWSLPFGEIDNRRSFGWFDSESERCDIQAKVEPAPKSPTPRSLPDAVEQLERWLIEDALRNSAGNKPKGAQVLGLSRQGLIRKLKRYGMTM